jgi:beta-phosphoglucomutase
LITACIFDLDGVLVDTARYHFLAWKRLAAELGFDLTEEVNEKLKGVSRMQSLEIILNLSGISLSEEEKEKLTTKKNGWFTDFIADMKADEIFPGVTPLLQKLKEENIKIALASSSKNAQRVIDLLGIRSNFDAVVDGNMIEHTKPDPEIFLLASKKLNVPPQQCLVFEDAEAGVEAAVRAGMKCVGIGNRDQLKQATVVLDAVKDFNYEQLQSI